MGAPESNFVFESHHVCSQCFFLLKVLPEPAPEQDEAHQVVAGDTIQPSGGETSQVDQAGQAGPVLAASSSCDSLISVFLNMEQFAEVPAWEGATAATRTQT